MFYFFRDRASRFFHVQCFQSDDSSHEFKKLTGIDFILDYVVLQVFFFVIISLSKKQFKKTKLLNLVETMIQDTSLTS